MSDGSPWVARLSAAESSALADLRLVAEIEAAEIDGVVWLRGPSLNDPLRLALRKIPGLCRFEILANETLRAEGARVPFGRLPDLRWQPLPQWLPVRFSTAPAATAMPSGVPLRLVRSSIERPATALLADLPAWLAFATQAPEIRLRPLRFAAARDGRVWIEGTPLPAVSGARFCEVVATPPVAATPPSQTVPAAPPPQPRLAIPCGFTCFPALSAVVLQRWLALAEGDTAFARADGAWEIIKAEQFIPASRSAVRATADALAHG